MQPLRAHSPAEATLYLKVTACPHCSRGPWEVIEAPAVSAGGDQQLNARCQACGYEQPFQFQCPPGQNQSDPEIINPSARPSQIIDVGQWISLFHFLVGSAAQAASPAQTRQVAFQAAQCLDEALKFYVEDNDLPPASGFFTPASQKAFHEHPENFARQKLRDLRGRLPSLPTMVGRLLLDQKAPAPKPPRWKFWKK